MPSDYQRICQDNIRRRGEEFDDIGRLISEQLYSDRTHFVYELLQNAEDALERRFRLHPDDCSPCKVEFRLYQERLEFRHCGALFTEEDVRGISDVLRGTKRDDLVQIGKFGIGFKSVYTFTASPEIHSGKEHFVIKRYIRPEAAPQKFIIGDHETVFNFPFDHIDLSAKDAFGLILNKLRGLGPRILLFLKRIDEIEWCVEPDGEKGQYVKEAKEVENIKNARRVTVIGQKNGQNDEENWLIFERPVTAPDGSSHVRVELGFRLEIKAKEEAEEITGIKDAPLVVYFPTEKATRFGFLIQGPYRTTPSRDNIPRDDDWNKKLIDETAQLIVESLRQCKIMDLLTVSLLEALPIRMDDFPPDSMFFPIVDAVRDSLMHEDLLPADDGTFISAGNAKIARSTDLRDLLTAEQLRLLFKAAQPVKWVSAEITQERTPELRRYLMEQLRIEAIRPEKFVDLLTDQFLEDQPDRWIISFYSFLGANRTELWKRPDAALRKRKIIRLEDNSHVVPFKSDGAPNAYLPSSTTTNFPTIKKSILVNEAAADFLRRLGIIEPDSFAEIIEFILPKYAEARIIVDYEENIDDLKKIKRLLEEPFHGSSSNSLSKVKILLGKLGLQEIEDHFPKVESGKFVPLLFKAVLPSIRFLRASNGQQIEYKSAENTYNSTPELLRYFQDNPEAWFIADDYPDEFSSLFQELGVNESPKVTKRGPDKNGFVIIAESRGYHSRGLKRFDPDIKVDGIEKAIASESTEVGAFIWNKIALARVYRLSEAQFESRAILI